MACKGNNNNEQPVIVIEMVQALLQTLAAHVPHPPSPTPYVLKDKVVEVVARFKKQNPHTLSNFVDPIVVEDWLRDIEMTSKLLTCSNI